jgi:hypothetical protein
MLREFVMNVVDVGLTPNLSAYPSTASPCSGSHTIRGATAGWMSWSNAVS